MSTLIRSCRLRAQLNPVPFVTDFVGDRFGPVFDLISLSQDSQTREFKFTIAAFQGRLQCKPRYTKWLTVEDLDVYDWYTYFSELLPCDIAALEHRRRVLQCWCRAISSDPNNRIAASAVYYWARAFTLEHLHEVPVLKLTFDSDRLSCGKECSCERFILHDV